MLWPATRGQLLLTIENVKLLQDLTYPLSQIVQEYSPPPRLQGPPHGYRGIVPCHNTLFQIVQEYSSRTVLQEAFIKMARQQCDQKKRVIVFTSTEEMSTFLITVRGHLTHYQEYFTSQSISAVMNWFITSKHGIIAHLRFYNLKL